MKNGRWMIWPERRFMSAEEIMSRANDVTADDGESDAFRGTLAQAVAILEDGGYATFAKRGVVPPESSEDSLRRQGMEGTRFLLREALSAAVPLWIETFRGLPWDDVLRIAREASDIVANQGDNILFRGAKKGDTAKAFNALARGVAALSFCPGGVTFMDLHFESEHGSANGLQGEKA